MSAVDAAALLVWTYDPVSRSVRDEYGTRVANVICGGDFKVAEKHGPLLAAAPLVLALVAAIHHLKGFLIRREWEQCEDIRALLAHPALTRLGEK